MATKFNLPQTGVMINKFIRYQELFILTDKTLGENEEMNQLQQDLIDYMITPNDFNNKVDADDYIKSNTFKETTGTSSAYIITLDTPITTLVKGQGWNIQPHINSTGSPTLKVSDTAAIAIIKPNGSPAKLLKNAIYTVRYNGVNFYITG